MESRHPVALVILDGFGYRAEKKYNAIAHARMPHFNQWWQKYPHAIIQAAGTAVGLPEGMIGNSEVGHLTLGAGRIIKQPMTLWLDSIKDGSFFHNALMLAAFKQLQTAGGTLHIIGLLSDAGVHAHEQEIYASIAAAVEAGIHKIVVHAFLDGRDTPPQSAHIYLEHLSHVISIYAPGRVIIGSLHGRFYAMDRDNNWDRIEKSYRVLTEKQEELALRSLGEVGWRKVLEHNYAQGITDEFIPPTQLDPAGYIHNGDGILFCNVRPDRARELTHCFVGMQRNRIKELALKPLNLTFFMTPTAYGVHLPTTVLFPREPVRNTLKDILVAHNKTIFTIAETEKYAHVTYFFRGEDEDAVATETRIMIPSIVVHDYIHNPRMSADSITDAVVTALRTDAYDFYLINYANADMVGHSGDFDATVRAVECLDEQLKKLYDIIVDQLDGTLYITSDHGKAELMFDESTGQPRTAHTNNSVPFIMIRKGLEHHKEQLPLHGLADVAPFILKNMGF